MGKVLQKSYSQNFKKKVFSDSEIEYCEKMKNSSPHFAVRWAIKEAFYKALPENLQNFSSWKSVEYINDGEKKPFVNIRDEFLSSKMREENISNIHCSVSHETDVCVAQIILENNGKRG
jgi:holo-[acyl-carrier protein] synthase